MAIDLSQYKIPTSSSGGTPPSGINLSKYQITPPTPPPPVVAPAQQAANPANGTLPPLSGLTKLAAKIPGVKTLGDVFGTALAYHGIGTGLPPPTPAQKSLIKSTMPTPEQAAGGFVQAASIPASIAVAPVSIPASIATGAGFGAAQGAAGTMERNAPVGTVAKEGGIGAVIGGAAGGLVGGAITGAGIAKKAISSQLAAREDDAIAEALTPKLTPTKYAAAGKAGQLAEPGLKEAGVSANTPQVQRAVSAVQSAASALGKKPGDIIKTGPLSSVTGNINRVKQTIGDYSEKVVKPFLSENKVPTNFADFIDYMKQVKPDEAIKANKDAYSTFNRVRERVINEVYSSLKSQSRSAGDFGSLTDPNLYWDARKRIDSIITEELGAKTLTDTGRTGVQAAAKSLREATADYIGDMLRFPGQMEQVARLREVANTLRNRGIELNPETSAALTQQMGLNPTGASVADQWEQHMQNLQGLYTANDNLATKVGKEQGKTAGKLFVKQHPTAVKILKTGAGAVGVGALFKGGENLIGD